MAHVSAQSAVPAVTVVLSAALVRLFPGCEARQDVSAADVAGLLDALDARWPGMRDRVRDSTPAIRKHMSVFVDGRRAHLDTPLRDGGTVYILTAMSGG
jgi:molybdopterin converting factor small subunit